MRNFKLVFEDIFHLAFDDHHFVDTDVVFEIDVRFKVYLRIVEPPDVDVVNVVHVGNFFERRFYFFDVDVCRRGLHQNVNGFFYNAVSVVNNVNADEC